MGFLAADEGGGGRGGKEERAVRKEILVYNTSRRNHAADAPAPLPASSCSADTVLRNCAMVASRSAVDDEDAVKQGVTCHSRSRATLAGAAAA